MGRNSFRIRGSGNRSSGLSMSRALATCMKGSTSGNCGWKAAKKATDIASSQFKDQDRTLLSTLRSAFVLTLQQKAILALAKANLDYYDNVLSISREQFRVGGIAKIDLDRLELQRVQYESDLESARVALEDRENPGSDAAERSHASEPV